MKSPKPERSLQRLANVYTSWMQRLPKSAAFLPLLIWAGGACAAAQSSTGTGGEAGAAASSSVTSSSSGGSTSSGETSTSTSSSASTGGMGGAGGSGGGSSTTTTASTGGSGGATTSSTSSTSGTGGGAPKPELVALVGGTNMYGCSFAESDGWTVQNLTGTTNAPTAVTAESVAAAVGLFRSGSAAELRFTKWDGSTWTGPLTIGMQAQAQGAPSMRLINPQSAVGYWGSDNKHYFAQYAGQNGGWSPVAEPVQPPAGVHSFGSSAPSIATLAAEVYLAHAGTDGKVYEQKRAAGVWQSAAGHDVGGINTAVTPTMVTLTGAGEDLMIVYALASNSQIGWITRKTMPAGQWSSGAVITDALTQTAVSVAPLPNGGAVMAFRGLNTNVYASVYQPGANPPWSAPMQVGGAGLTTPSAPAVAPGAGMATAELLVADTQSQFAKHSRLINGVWTTPVDAAGPGVSFVGLTKIP
ncbi:MAG: hypothetical protein IPK82_17330 [Polyangiaceae bacterium]|nr:hypothetical protein [Polyangiaceae bacterium]